MKSVTLTLSVLCLAAAACSSGVTASQHGADAGSDAPVDAGHVDGEVTSCPPAPLEGEYENKPCNDPQLDCPYASPNGFQYDRANLCDVKAAGACHGGLFLVWAENPVLCCPEGPKDVTFCTQPVTEGAPCNQPDNSECVLPDQSATCACDKPGPVWRCLPLDAGVQYCSCLDNGDCVQDAGAEAADAG